eukprot:1737337-Rhodomonas_salina.1
MLILHGWDSQDFIPLAEFQKHKDVIVPLAVKLASHSGKTVLVKLKSHTVVSLNEEADVEANKGLSSLTYHPASSPVSQSLLSPVAAPGSPIADFSSHVRQGVIRSGLDNIRTGGSLTTESYLWEGRGQCYLHSTRQSLPEKLQRRMLQLLGGVFPCWLRSYCIGRADSAACKLCGLLETPSHILCTCPPLSDVITASPSVLRWGRRSQMGKPSSRQGMSLSAFFLSSHVQQTFGRHLSTL